MLFLFPFINLSLLCLFSLCAFFHFSLLLSVSCYLTHHLVHIEVILKSYCGACQEYCVTSSQTQMILLVTQQTLLELDESRAVLGLLLDQGKLLQAEPGFAASLSQAGGALELRWKSIYSRTEQEIQRCRDIQDSRARWARLKITHEKS